MSTEQITDTNSILDLLKEVNKAMESKIYIPTLKKDMTVKPLNANHIKNILKTTIEGPFTDNQFVLVSYNILKEILNIPLSELTLVDKNVILVQLRQKNISDTLTIIKKDNSDEDETKKTEKIKIEDYIDYIKNSSWDISKVIIGDDDFKVELNMPTIEDEYRFELNLFRTKYSNIDQENKKALKSLFSPMFISNLARYLRKIYIKDKEINVYPKTVDEILAIMESLPSSILTKMVNEIDKKFGVYIQNTIKFNDGIFAVDQNLFVNED